MIDNAAKTFLSGRVGKAAAASLCSLALTVLVGCQGFSSGNSSNKPAQQVSTLSASASTLQFGNVAAGSNKTQQVTVANSGPSNITVSSATVSTKYFTVTAPSLPLSVASGQSATVTIEFTPNAAGTFNATLTLASDAANAAMNLALSGTGMGTSTAGQLVVTPSSGAFGSVTVGNQQSDTVTLTNTGGSSVNISQASINGTGFSVSGITPPLSLGVSQSTTFTVSFSPQATGASSGALTVTSDASDATLVMPLSGTGIAPGALGSNPTSLGFGAVTVGNNQSLSETILNSGGTSITISQVAITGSGFGLSGITAPVTLNAGQAANFSVTFTPQSSGSASGTITITSTATNPTLTIPLSGTGTSAVGQLAVSPSTLAIGNVAVGSSGTASGVLTASGASVKVTAAGTNNSAFSLSGLTLPVTIPAGQSIPFTVAFTPQSTGAASATLTFTSNAQTTSTTETLTGTGTAAATHDVNLSWSASTSSNITGYNIYRAVYTTACGSFSKINSSLNTTLLYTDSVVVDGTSYCYATTAVSSGNDESSYSNIVSNVKIPSP